MLYYPDGNEVRVGDRVSYEGEPSVVEEVIDDEAERLEWRVDFLGILLSNRAFGRVYVEPGEVVFISRSLAD